MDERLHVVALNRQQGLTRELAAIANNVANAATSGFRREGVVFAEYVSGSGVREAGSLSMADMSVRYVSEDPGQIGTTGRALDLAIEGEGYFAISRGDETLLTRSGAFQLSETGVLVTPSGEPVLDVGGGPIRVPPEAFPLTISQDGTIAGTDGPLGQISVMRPGADALLRRDGHALRSDMPPEPVDAPRIRQGSLEESNVEPVEEMARMIEVTRAYESVQSLIEADDGRIRNVLERLGRAV